MNQLAPPIVSQSIHPHTPVPHSLKHALNFPFSLAELKGVLNTVKDSSRGEDRLLCSFFVNLNEVALTYVLV